MVSSHTLDLNIQPDSRHVHLGGALVLTSLARSIGETPLSTPARSALPAQALVYDSLPGAISLRVTVLAFTAPIRSAPLRAVAKVVFGTAYIVGAIWRRTISLFFGKSKDTFGRLHDDLNDSKLLPQRVPRTYLYSDADELIPMDVVEGHARKTKELLELDGVDSDVVKLVKFKGSSHVAHARKDPQRYWDAVVETWGASCRK
jgi:pimeloyl-ACP methyl ester carboxylesterase